MAAVWSRRLASSVKDYLLSSSRGRLQVTRMTVSPCSTTKSSGTTESSPAQTDNKGPDAFDASEVEEILTRQTTMDMPVEMPNPYEREKLQCILCNYKVHLDYKNVRLLSQFVSPFTGQIYGRHITRLCRRQQSILEREIQKSRDSGLMPVMLKSVEFLKDPKLFDPNNPVRPHEY
ncbi:28S ribosomal protein S18c, mitochondrial-like [Penaeus japonicus]|uniref:28S ribosomal protein S18c, mitochondrial-like n=1 Tax=Penaeus japonicus TaxID=27405 RepID=UPI001C716D60|nr:28S ribosomal protein S18c, mitochondrial-like [Penaeus japonicus]XP_042880858.1 28S ribosomal protein S18c, mitochondrial-like [Penaeus japonicus]